MIEISNPERFGEYRAQRYSEAIPAGWVVVAIGQTSELVSVARSHPAAHGGTVTGYDQAVANEAIVLLGRLKDTTIADLYANEVAHVAKIVELDKKLGNRVKECAELDKKLESSGQLYEELSGYFNRLKEQFGEQRDVRQKLEGDIAKIRSHFGEKAMREALEKP